jgi:hypothetical protein
MGDGEQWQRLSSLGRLGNNEHRVIHPLPTDYEQERRALRQWAKRG